MGVYEREGVCQFLWRGDAEQDALRFDEGDVGLFHMLVGASWIAGMPHRVRIRIEAEPLTDDEAKAYWEGEDD